MVQYEADEFSIGGCTSSGSLAWETICDCVLLVVTPDQLFMLPTPLSPSVSSMSTFREKIGLARRLFSVFCSFLINVTMEYDIHAIPYLVSLHRAQCNINIFCCCCHQTSSLHLKHCSQCSPLGLWKMLHSWDLRPSVRWLPFCRLATFSEKRAWDLWIVQNPLALHPHT